MAALPAANANAAPRPPELVRVFKGHTNAISGVHFHPLMHQLVSSSHDGKLYIWHFKQQLRPFKFEGHKGEVNDVSLSRDGTHFASASSDKTVNLWMNNSKGTPTHTIKAHTGAVRSCHYSSDNGFLVTASDDKIVKVWQVTPSSSKFVTSLEGHTHWVRSARFSTDDSNLITSCGDDKSVRVWDLRVSGGTSMPGAHSAGGGKDRGCVMKMHEHTDRVNRSLFHPDGTCIASCSDDRTIKIWDLRRKRLIQHYDAHNGSVTDVCFSSAADKNFLASCSVDRNVKLWDLQEGRLLYTMAGHEDTVSSIQFSQRGQFLVSGGRDNKIFIWKTGLFPEAGEVPQTSSSATNSSAQVANNKANGTATSASNSSGIASSRPGGANSSASNLMNMNASSIRCVDDNNNNTASISQTFIPLEKLYDQPPPNMQAMSNNASSAETKGVMGARSYLYNAPKSSNSLSAAPITGAVMGASSSEPRAKAASTHSLIKNASNHKGLKASGSCANTSAANIPGTAGGQQHLLNTSTSNLSLLDSSMVSTKFADAVNSDIGREALSNSAQNSPVKNNSILAGPTSRVTGRDLHKSKSNGAASRPKTAPQKSRPHTKSPGAGTSVSSINKATGNLGTSASPSMLQSNNSSSSKTSASFFGKLQTSGTAASAATAGPPVPVGGVAAVTASTPQQSNTRTVAEPIKMTANIIKSAKKEEQPVSPKITEVPAGSGTKFVSAPVGGSGNKPESGVAIQPVNVLHSEAAGQHNGSVVPTAAQLSQGLTLSQMGNNSSSEKNVNEILSQMSSQLAMLMRTVQVMDHRMTVTEQAIARIEHRTDREAGTRREDAAPSSTNTDKSPSRANNASNSPGKVDVAAVVA